jgi:hypothetical protein
VCVNILWISWPRPVPFSGRVLEPLRRRAGVIRAAAHLQS